MYFSRSIILNIFIGVIFIFAVIIFLDVININLNTEQTNKKVVQVVNIEALKNNKKSKKTHTTTTTNDVNTTDNTSNDSTTTTTNEIPSPPESNTSINLNPISDFCKSSSSSLKESCGKLTKNNCNATTCCVMLNGKKCVAGNQDGPTFKTESGEDINIDYYYYQNKCYGNSCPTK